VNTEPVCHALTAAKVRIISETTKRLERFYTKSFNFLFHRLINFKVKNYVVSEGKDKTIFPIFQIIRLFFADFSPTMSMKAQKTPVSPKYLPYLCRAKETWLRPQKQTSNSPFKKQRSYEQDGKDYPSGDQLHHHPYPRSSRWQHADAVKN